LWVYELHTAGVCCVAHNAKLRGSRLRLPRCGIVCGFAAHSLQLRAEHAHSRLARVDPPMPKSSNAVRRRFARKIHPGDPGRRPEQPSLWCVTVGLPLTGWGPIRVGLPVCLRAWGTPITRRAVLQASGCDPSAVASRGDRRAQRAEEPVRRCTQHALHASRPRRATVRRRFIDRCNLTKLPDSICNLTVVSSLYAWPPGWRRSPILARAPRTAAGPQGRVEECPHGAPGVRVQHGQPNVAVRAVMIVEACVAAPSRALLPQERGAQPAASAA
jgi:hypothetical protein